MTEAPSFEVWSGPALATTDEAWILIAGAWNPVDVTAPSFEGPKSNGLEPDPLSRCRASRTSSRGRRVLRFTRARIRELPLANTMLVKRRVERGHIVGVLRGIGGWSRGIIEAFFADGGRLRNSALIWRGAYDIVCPRKPYVGNL